MKLTGRVTKLESGTSFGDGIQRAFIKVDEADSAMYAEIRVRNTEGWVMDTILIIDVYHPTLHEAIAAGVTRG